MLYTIKHRVYAKMRRQTRFVTYIWLPYARHALYADDEVENNIVSCVVVCQRFKSIFTTTPAAFIFYFDNRAT